MKKYLEYLRVLAPLAVVGVVLVAVSVLLGGCSSQTPEQAYVADARAIAAEAGVNIDKASDDDIIKAGHHECDRVKQRGYSAARSWYEAPGSEPGLKAFESAIEHLCPSQMPTDAATLVLP